MLENKLNFEPSRSFAYHFVRYTLLPLVDKEVEKLGSNEFLLRDIAWPIIDSLLTQEQQSVLVERAQSEGKESVSRIVRFYVNFLAKELGLYESLGKGYFRVKFNNDITDDDLVDAAIESGDEEAGEGDGWIYAFSFPLIVKTDGVFPIKIGMTRGEVESRVSEQAKGSAAFEQPTILGRWQVKRVGPTELAIHNVLKARNRWREDAPGREWFNTTVSDIDSIIQFVQRA